ncbi:MAG: 16S rRNA (cytosine(1402)-N(4))-methyltransferase RsmH [Microgenomates group bacterium]
MEYHVPVLLHEAINLLDIKHGQIYLDCTLGNGGHTQEILKRGGIVYGIDNDPHNLEIAIDRIKTSGLSTNFHPIKDNFGNLLEIINKNHLTKIAGVLIDLGLSSNQQKSSQRGFSFNDELSLDMRLDPQTQTLTAEEIINTYSYDQLYEIFTKLAQETQSKPLIIRIISARQKEPIRSGHKLSQIVRDYYQSRHIHPKTDPSTKIFMALRIYVNSEFENLKKILLDSLELTGTQVVIISFHSGEDRIVKNFIRVNTQSHLIDNLTPKAITPTLSEIHQNNLSRSAVLRSYKIL